MHWGRSGEMFWWANRGELVMLYAFLWLFFAAWGAGSFSVDAWLRRRREVGTGERLKLDAWDGFIHEDFCYPVFRMPAAMPLTHTESASISSGVSPARSRQRISACTMLMGST